MRLTLLQSFLASALVLCACASTSTIPLVQASPSSYQRVRPPAVVLEPSTVVLSGGEALLVRATARGGEAIRFTIDWEIKEGSAGGSVKPIGGRSQDGTYQAQYRAPTEGTGPFHLIARIHEFPGAFATTIVTVHAQARTIEAPQPADKPPRSEPQKLPGTQTPASGAAS